MRLRLGDGLVAEVEYAEDRDSFHGILIEAPGLRAGDLVEFYGRDPDELRAEARRSLAFYREVAPVG
jgi:hypothetical protein